ncbi:T-cell-interacting, activating receptor on myeloid cells protein 1-like isoform X2 [Ambystoma mexicanum]|uniref:T-cell-interacting, activating receptor on myeloid cells protein 1-like isoform X2 n=1 Tax=Ambystoma mexicanum TaxID=8296 RepID=UPI0037E98E49
MLRVTAAALLAALCFLCQLSGAVHVSHLADLSRPAITWQRSTIVKGGYEVVCLAPRKYSGSLFKLYQRDTYFPVREHKASATNWSVVFLFGNGTLVSERQYRCQYQTRVLGKLMTSNFSKAITVTPGLYPKPAISVSPSNPIQNGGSATVHCQGPHRGVTFALYKGRILIDEQDSKDQQHAARFQLLSVGPPQRGRYNCYYYRQTVPVLWSHPSDDLNLRVTGVPSEPTVHQVKSFQEVQAKAVNCSATPAASGAGWFYLFREGEQEPLARQRSPVHHGRTMHVFFNVTDTEWFLGPQERYGCLYQAEEDLTLGVQSVLVPHSAPGPGPQVAHLSTENLVRIGLAALVLLLALLFVAEACFEERGVKRMSS